jgi:transposase
LIESHPVNISTIARCYDLKPRTLFEWYKNAISDYYPEKASGHFAGQKGYEVDKETGEIHKEQVVHIFQPGHMGDSMCIDEKMIGKRYYTVFSNYRSGYIALMIESIRPVVVKEALLLFGQELLGKVQYITADMSHSMKNICKTVFPQARIIIDKFHVIKHLMEAMQSVRLQVKKEIQIERKQQKEKQEELLAEEASGNPNGWTDLELLEKTRYFLWRMYQELEPEDAFLLDFTLDKFPLLKSAYNLCQQLRLWYQKSNIGKNTGILLAELRRWKEKVKQANIKEFSQVPRMIENHQTEIIHYFENGLTNAKAENLNGKIQRFIANNFGIRNRDFFIYRMQVYFSPAPQKKI